MRNKTAESKDLAPEARGGLHTCPKEHGSCGEGERAAVPSAVTFTALYLRYVFWQRHLESVFVPQRTPVRWGGGGERGGDPCTPHSPGSHQATGPRIGFITGQKTGSGRVFAHPLFPISPSVGRSASLFQLSESAV